MCPPSASGPGLSRGQSPVLRVMSPGMSVGLASVGSVQRDVVAGIRSRRPRRGRRPGDLRAGRPVRTPAHGRARAVETVGGCAGRDGARPVRQRLHDDGTFLGHGRGRALVPARRMQLPGQGQLQARGGARADRDGHRATGRGRQQERPGRPGRPTRPGSGPSRPCWTTGRADEPDRAGRPAPGKTSRWPSRSHCPRPATRPRPVTRPRPGWAGAIQLRSWWRSSSRGAKTAG